MWVLATINADGKRVNLVSASRLGLDQYISHAQEYGHVWRLWHNGWVKGSQDAGIEISNIAGEPATIVY